MNEIAKTEIKKSYETRSLVLAIIGMALQNPFSIPAIILYIVGRTKLSFAAKLESLNCKTEAQLNRDAAERMFRNSSNFGMAAVCISAAAATIALLYAIIYLFICFFIPLIFLAFMFIAMSASIMGGCV